MLQADKQVLLAGVKRNALELRQRELEFHVERYTNLATQASVVAGFSFESLVELEVPEGTPPLLSACYFVCGASAMALSLYVLCIASFACVFGHRLALQGPHGSLERAVHILIDHRIHIFAMAALSLAFLVSAAVFMAWIKMGAAASLVTIIFLVFALSVYKRMTSMFEIFHIPEDKLVTGALRVSDPASGGNAVVDLARLNPSSRNAQAAPPNVAEAAARGVPYSRLVEEQAEAMRPNALDRQAAREPSPMGGSKHEGWLFKKGEKGAFFGTDKFQRRYCVLQGPYLFYFRSWEDYGAATGPMAERLRVAVNHGAPIDVRQYDVVRVREADSDMPNRFDLVPTNPLDRKFELQGVTLDETEDWINQFRMAKRGVSSAAPGGNSQPHVIVQD